jgi:hypothetical protein
MSKRDLYWIVPVIFICMFVALPLTVKLISHPRRRQRAGATPEGEK